MNAVNRTKRISRNIIFLYLRTVVTTVISLYTSRLVLSYLGLQDFGIYNVVGGVITMFSFLNASLSVCIQRYINIAIGERNMDKLSLVFTQSMIIQFIVSLIILFLGETVGLWFLQNEMTIPTEKSMDALWVYQCSIISFIIIVLSSPYNAVIIAYEKVRAFAYISIIESILRLLACYALSLVNTHRLIYFAVFILIIQLIILATYRLYCNKNIKHVRFLFSLDRKLIKEMGQFMRWNMLGDIAYIFSNQGLNIILNIFGGPFVNAARGVSYQIQNALMGLFRNVLVAITPQITQSYTQLDFEYMHKLIISGSKFIFISLFIVAFPIWLYIDKVLYLWLGQVPEYSVTFCRIMLITSIISATSDPLLNGMRATGKIKQIQSIENSILILLLPFSYILLKLGYPFYYAFLVHLLLIIIIYICRIVLVLPHIHLLKKEYLKEVPIRILKSTSVGIFIPVILYLIVDKNTVLQIVIAGISVLLVGVSFFFIGLNLNERKKVLSIILQKKIFN